MSTHHFTMNGTTTSKTFSTQSNNSQTEKNVICCYGLGGTVKLPRLYFTSSGSSAITPISTLTFAPKPQASAKKSSQKSSRTSKVTKDTNKSFHKSSRARRNGQTRKSSLNDKKLVRTPQ